MTDDQTPGVAAMGERERDTLAEIIFYASNPNMQVRPGIPESAEWFFRNVAAAVLAAGYRLAAGPTKAEVLAAVDGVRQHESLEPRSIKLVSRWEVKQALTALWPDGEHQADTVTISRDDLRARIEKAWRWLHCGTCGRKYAEDRPENVRLVVNSFMDAIAPDHRTGDATARPHQADPQEAM